MSTNWCEELKKHAKRRTVGCVASDQISVSGDFSVSHFVRLGVLIRASASESRSQISFAVLIPSSTNLTTLRTKTLHDHTLDTL
jgi:hypothetical protein